MGRGGFSGSSSGRSSSGGSSSRSFSGGWGGSSRGGYRRSSGNSGPVIFGGGSSGRYSNPSYYYGPSGGCCLFSGLSTLVTIAVIFIVVFVFFYGITKSYFGGVKNEINREKLQSSALLDTYSVINDEAKWLSNKESVRRSMDYFRNKTGVQPMLIIADNLKGSKEFTSEQVNKYIDEIYSNAFKDEGHMILYFCEPYEEHYYRGILCGTAAKTVIDSNAQDIIYDYVDKYYYSDYTDDQYFSRIFRDSADKIMSKVTSPEDVKRSIIMWAAIIFIVGISGIIIVKVVNSKMKEKELAAKILNADIGKDDYIKEVT